MLQSKSNELGILFFHLASYAYSNYWKEVLRYVLTLLSQKAFL